MAANLASLLCHDGKRKITTVPKIIDQPGFVIAAKGVDNDPPDGLLMF